MNVEGDADDEDAWSEKWKSLSCVWLFATPWTVCSPPGSSVHGIFQARILEWIAIPFSSVSSQPRNHTGVSCIAGRFFTNCLQLVSVFLVSELPFLAFQFYSLMNSDSVIPQPHQGLKSDFTTFLFDSQSLHLLPLLLPLTAYPNFIP